ncbi:MAG: hypothetical protein ABWX61_07310 [Paenisporosarcina sp.]
MERWRYKEIPELSDIQVKLIRIGSVIAMILLTIYLISVAIETFTPTPPFPEVDVLDGFK